MPDEMPKAKAKKPVKFLMGNIEAGAPAKPEDLWPIYNSVFPFQQMVNEAKKNKIPPSQFPGGLENLLDPQVKNWCGDKGFTTTCWAEMCFLYVDKVLQAQAFFVFSGDRDKWIEAATKYCKNLKAKEAFIQKLRYYPGAEEVEVLQLNLETGKEELYLNGPKADKDKLNAFLHKVGKHHI